MSEMMTQNGVGLSQLEPLHGDTPSAKSIRRIAGRKPHLFVTVFLVWGLLLVWFLPRLVSVLDASETLLSTLALAYFVLFVPVAWLYGIYNIAVIAFAAIHRRSSHAVKLDTQMHVPTTPVAVLYTTCNDFVEMSALSCVELDYHRFRVYILDDSSQQEYIDRIDTFAAQLKGKVRVIRRSDRQGFKAGNLNHALNRFVREPLFVIADADEVLPRD